MIRIGARNSKLSALQTRLVAEKLQSLGYKVQLEFYKSRGDVNTITPLRLLQQDGVFTSHLETLLLQGEIDLAIHSLKDLPTLSHPKLKAIPILPREDPRDVLIIHKDQLVSSSHSNHTHPLTLKTGTRIATSSLRRQAQLKHEFQGVSLLDLRGNIDTRLKRLFQHWFDGLLMAKAALNRYPIPIPNDYEVISLPLELFPTSPGQGSLAAQYNSANLEIQTIVQQLIDTPSFHQVSLERQLLREIGGGCQTPLGLTVYNTLDGIALSYFNTKPTVSHHSAPSYERVFLKHDTIESLRTHALSYFSSTSPQLSRRVAKPPTIKNNNSPDSPSILVPRPENDEIVTHLSSLGYKVFSLPLHTYFPVLVDLSKAKTMISHSSWVLFTSKRGVLYCPPLLRKLLREKRIGAIGSTTAEYLHSHSLPVHYVARTSTGRGLAEELLSIDPNLLAVAHITSTRPSPGLHQVLTQKGVQVFTLPVYKQVRLMNGIPLDLDSQSFSWVLAFSGSQARELYELLGSKALNWVAIGSETKRVLESLGVPRVLSPPKQTVESVIEVLLNELQS